MPDFLNYTTVQAPTIKFLITFIARLVIFIVSTRICFVWQVVVIKRPKSVLLLNDGSYVLP